jgi:hypothetical protein
MPPENRFVCRFAAEPPQEALATGRWAETLGRYFTAAIGEIDAGDDDLGEPGELNFHPDRTWNGRTYVPITTRSTTGLDVYGYVSFEVRSGDGPAEDETTFAAVADYTDETAEANPEWRLDLCDEVVGTWRGENGKQAAMTLIWGTSLVRGGALVTAELAALAVDQCTVDHDRFTLVAPDDYRGDFLDIVLWDRRGGRLAGESLYADGEEEGP